MINIEEKIIIIQETKENINGFRWRQPIIKHGSEMYIDIKKINLEEYNIKNKVINSITLEIEILEKLQETIKKINPRKHHKENRIVKIRQIE